MKNKDLDDVQIKCSRCGKPWLGKHVNNPYENQGICDWCALGIMCADLPPLPPGTKIVTVEFDKDGKPGPISERTVEPRPRTPKPSEVN